MPSTPRLQQPWTFGRRTFSAGIGGGGFLMLYDEQTNRTARLRGALPPLRQNMYHKNGKADPLLSRDGYKVLRSGR